MNWLYKIALPVKTQDLPQILARAIQYECGGKWKAGKAKNWTEDLQNIIGDTRLSDEKGYSTSFWITCETGDGMFNQKWGVSVNFSVTSGSSNTIFDSATGDWDLSITANVQWASPASWTPGSPYALLIKTVGHRDDMKTIREVAQFVKQAIWDSQQDDDDDNNQEPEIEPTPDPTTSAPASPELITV